MLKRLISLVIISMLLGACVAKYETTYSYDSPASTSGKRCVEQCERSKYSCQKLCSNNTSLCEIKARKRAKSSFDEYVSKQKLAGNLIIRDLDSFYSPKQCPQQSCQCKADFKACFDMCGGKVTAHKKCIANCDKA